MGSLLKKPELLAPAGNFTKLETAFKYGADAVYLGGQAFGLRARADNFSLEEIENAVKLADSLGKKVYVTMNIISRDGDMEDICKYAKELESIHVHGVIIADIGTFFAVKQAAPKLAIHVSTQANNLNSETIKFWLSSGATRVNLARELSFDEISGITKKLWEWNPALMNSNEPVIEAFVHGAMCMSFSGRCMLSDYLADRSSNRGDCAQPCRWKYYVSEETRPGEYMQVEDNERGTYIFNSKDLCMIEYLPEILKSGIQSLKIEGRMKSEFYTAVTVRAYRIAIDECIKDPEGFKNNKKLIDELLGEVCSVSHRDYYTGFYLGGHGKQIYSSSSYVRDTDFIGNVEVVDNVSDSGEEMYKIGISLRGAFNVGDELEFVIPLEREIYKIKADKITDKWNNIIERANLPKGLYFVNSKRPVPIGTVVRYRKKV